MEVQEIINGIEKSLVKEISNILLPGSWRYYFEFRDLRVEFEDSTVLFHLDVTFDLNDKIESINIFDSYIQFSDFECVICKKYIKKIEDELKGATLYF